MTRTDRPLVYVMTATKWQAVNLAPLIEEGRLPDMLVMLVARSGGTGGDVDRREAEDPAMNFLQAWKILKEERQLSGQPDPLTIVIEGNLQEIGHWRREIRERLDPVETGVPDGARILFNYQGGPSQVKIGAWLGLDDLAAARPDLTVERVGLAGGGRLLLYDDEGRETSAPVSGLTPRVWLALRGRYETEGARQARETREREARAFARQTRALAEACMKQDGMPPDWAIGVLSGLKAQAREDRIVNLFQRARSNSGRSLADVSNQALRRAIGVLAGALNDLSARFPGVHVNGQNLTIPAHSPAREWLAGGWLEDFVYNQMVQRCGTARVLLDLNLQERGHDVAAEKNLQGVKARQIDVAVMGATQMYAIECKAHARRNRGPDGTRQMLDQCVAISNAVIGQFGLVQAVTTRPFTEESPVPFFAANAGIGLASGWDEIQAACDRIAQKCGCG